MKDYAPEEKAILKQLEDGLSPNLHYHGLHHTRDVMEAALRIASSEGLPEDQIRLLRIAVLYHDSGFVVNSKDHESHGCEIAKRNLPAYGYSPKEIETICGMIMATRIPQSPHNLLEKIICDADLDYLGRDDFNRISRSLYEEI
ncbi:MAG: HD domain-containing protein, partial [Bacteroidota bacterium]|nr:HD domain-containing protein [Bacteroidota bacterium]